MCQFFERRRSIYRPLGLGLEGSPELELEELGLGGSPELEYSSNSWPPHREPHIVCHPDLFIYFSLMENGISTSL